MRTTSTTRPVICAIGVCKRDLELAVVWLRWVTFLSQQPGGSPFYLMICVTREIAREHLDKKLEDALGTRFSRPFRAEIFIQPDEDEGNYPRSASHQFLRTLECAEARFPASNVLWLEVDAWPTKPTWFSEINAEYQTCGQPFLGSRVGKKHIQMSGVAIYPHDWRKRAPKIADVLSAPDLSQWGVGKGMPWDVYARDQIVPHMAESKLMVNVWKERQIRPTALKDVPESCCLFHQDKTGGLIREIAALRYPEFMSTLTSGRRFFFMNGHPSRVAAKGLRIKFSYHKFSGGFHRTAVCSDELTENDASALATLVGQLGIREMTEDEFLKLTGRQAKSLPPARVRTIERPPSNHSHPQVFVMLGRYGDIINILPLLKAEADAGRRPTLVVSKDFQDILDGVSYCDRIVWDGAYDQLPEALRWLRASKKIMAPVVAQVHRNPLDRARLCDSYQREAWRLAGRLGDFETRGPLVFDQRDTGRETKLVWDLVGENDHNAPIVLVGLRSHSSPLAQAPKIFEAIRKRWPKFSVIDLATVKAERPYDLLGLFETASLIVSSDTMFGHLSRAVNRPLLALKNDGWRGSTFEHAEAVMRYAEVTPDAVVKAAEDILTVPQEIRDTAKVIVNTMGDAVKKAWTPRVFHCVDVYGDDARHQTAQATWAAAYDEGMVAVHLHEYARDAKTELGHKKSLPFLKDILQAGLNESANDDDVVVWTNGDIGFMPGATEAIGTHVRQYGAASMRRTESNGEHHMGRDMFAFTAKWLRENFDEIPDYVIGVPVFDLGLVAMIRLKAGIKIPLTTKNVGVDMPPADMPPGLTLHQSHVSEWLELNHHTKPATKHNHNLFYEWTRKFAPATVFSKGHNLV